MNIGTLAYFLQQLCWSLASIQIHRHSDSLWLFSLLQRSDGGTNQTLQNRKVDRRHADSGGNAVAIAQRVPAGALHHCPRQLRHFRQLSQIHISVNSLLIENSGAYAPSRFRSKSRSRASLHVAAVFYRMVYNI